MNAQMQRHITSNLLTASCLLSLILKSAASLPSILHHFAHHSSLFNVEFLTHYKGSLRRAVMEILSSRRSKRDSK
jgi:hypothetical protein